MDYLPTFKTILLEASNALKVEDARFEAKLLLEHAVNVNRAWLIAHENDVLETQQLAAFEALLHRRLKGEPIAYILGFREFYGLNLKVTPHTLIPRPDTETLVEAAMAKIPAEPLFLRRRDSSSEEKPEACQQHSSEAETLTAKKNFRILDLGTGTGAIALAIAQHHPSAEVVAVDASQAALAVAGENADHLNIFNVRFALSNWFAALPNERFDLIVSNPPYIEAEDEHLQQGDLRFEPLSALASGRDGLDDIRKIIKSAPQFLNPLGWLMLEHGYNQAEQVADLLKLAGFHEIATIQDLANIPRVTMGRI